MKDFESELKSGFLEEAAQNLAEAERSYMALEGNPGDSRLLEQIFRLMHNLKGGAQAVGFTALGDAAHELESILLGVKNGTVSFSADLIGVLLKFNDRLAQHVQALKKDFGSTFDSAALKVELREQIASLTAGKATGEVATEEAAAVEVSAEPSLDLERDFQQLASLTQEFMETECRAAPLGNASDVGGSGPAKVVSGPAPTQTNGHAPAGMTEESIRVNLGRLERLLNCVGELVILQSVIREQADGQKNLLLRKSVHQLSKVTKEVQDISMSLRMVPLKQTFQKMQRIVRDTSLNLGKKVNLSIEGDQTEVDKTLLESLGDPLVHLVRNAVDHGIESADERRANGKPETGSMVLRAFHQSGSLVIEVIDDGSGMNPERLIQKAIEKGIIAAGTRLSTEEACQLVFKPGFSTKSQVTDVSGRGVGLDVVKTNVERLQGSVSIETTLGKGTIFRIKLPLTLAIIDALVVRIADDRFVVPIAHVHESIRPSLKDIHPIAGIGEVFSLRGEQLPLMRLPELLGRRGPRSLATEGIALIVRAGTNPFAVWVDDILGQQQVVIKQLGSEHSGKKGFAGSTILGDGRPALILEMAELVEAGNKEVRTWKPQTNVSMNVAS